MAARHCKGSYSRGAKIANLVRGCPVVDFLGFSFSRLTFRSLTHPLSNVYDEAGCYLFDLKAVTSKLALFEMCPEKFKFSLPGLPTYERDRLETLSETETRSEWYHCELCQAGAASPLVGSSSLWGSWDWFLNFGELLRQEGPATSRLMLGYDLANGWTCCGPTSMRQLRQVLAF